jgi:hypothetical protein
MRLSRSLIPYVLAGGFALAAAGAWPAVQAERRAAVAEAQTTEALGGPDALFWEDEDAPAACDAGCPPRVAAAVGARLAADAAQTRDLGVRLHEAEQAEALLVSAVKARPAAGEWWAWLAFARTLDGEETPQVLQALGQSYRRAPYLSSMARWRIGLAGAVWPLLTPDVKAAAANEVAWLNAVRPAEDLNLAALVVAHVRDPQARAALGAALQRPLPTAAPHRISGGPGGIGVRR